MKAAVLGSGLMGSVVGWDLARSRDVDEVVVADIDRERLGAAKKRSPGKKLSTEVLDIRDKKKVVSFLKGFDASASALPHGVVHISDVAAVEAGAKMVNLAFEDEQMGLDAAARKSGALIIPGCGVAPGLGGILLTHALKELGGGDVGHILVGGIPQNPVPPCRDRLGSSNLGQQRENTDQARVVRYGNMFSV